MQFTKPSKTTISYTLNGVLLALLLAASAAYFTEHAKVAETNLTLKAANEKIAAMSNTIGTLTTSNETLKQDLQKAQPVAQEPDSSQTEDRIAAFAKQAATCEAIRQKLHIKG